jgi:hypothetical protein
MNCNQYYIPSGSPPVKGWQPARKATIAEMMAAQAGNFLAEKLCDSAKYHLISG